MDALLHVIYRVMSTRTFPGKRASNSLEELEPERVSDRLLQLHFARPQTRFLRGQDRLTGRHLHRSAWVPLTHLRTGTRDKHLQIRAVRSQDHTEAKQHGLLQYPDIQFLKLFYSVGP